MIAAPVTLIATVSILIALDAVWLFIRSDYHTAFFANVQGGKPLTVRWIPAGIVYLILGTALLYLAIRGAASVKDAALRGAAIGGLLYGFYDATNMATLRGWSWYMTITDTMWGAICSSIASAAVYSIFYK